jgi:hypothetical protein
MKELLLSLGPRVSKHKTKPGKGRGRRNKPYVIQGLRP